MTTANGTTATRHAARTASGTPGPDNTCAACAYFEPKAKRCHRNPPLPKHNYNEASFPFIAFPDECWCGCWRGKTP